VHDREPEAAYPIAQQIAAICPSSPHQLRNYGAISVNIGRGLTEAADKWTVKAIIEVPINQLTAHAIDWRQHQRGAAYP
jgi:hypothetical protein